MSPDVKPLKLGDSDAMQAGDFVLAVGNPFGFEETVTDGIISSKGRPNRVDGFGDFLQTNAAINPGNSGGPLINLRGEVIGINTAIISRSGGSQGIGFAIPSNTVQMALRESAQARAGSFAVISASRRRRTQPGKSARATIPACSRGGVVPNSPAAEAQIQRGDVIQKFDGHDVRNIAELRRLVSQVELDKKVDVQVARNGKPVTVSAQDQGTAAKLLNLARALPPDVPGQQSPPSPDEPDTDEPEQSRDGGILGSIEVRELTPQLAQRAGCARRASAGSSSRRSARKSAGDNCAPAT